MWFRPLVAKRLKEEGIASDGDLVDFCNARGGSWWMSMPRIGVGHAPPLCFLGRVSMKTPANGSSRCHER
ncbi:phage integrase family protein (plasmid) [Paraburkholderia strydomiana]